MSKTSMSIRLDSEVKEQAQLVFNLLGMDMTTAINIFLRQAIQYQGLPFVVKLDDHGKLLQVVTDVEQNRNMSHPYESVSDLMEDLRA
ncbi:type II toxin-antitoxin system RelB/DinJ family antitoxin [Streptococcus parasanguinis]|uniref:type II toxin-antitoxin system RelB/DinJ family antitoxin n=1 Tax=Streptococcus parasanguinis TaxID=1318 RepID=UPI001911C4D9|nr:type II toxin-antitoxin system RelB/DinJ family antitoxin [Streptococcus parasanguinis]MBK5031277.1 type II toxin-antitoxin system RelB/DinJ family antitoxin [Streptococcus parasanguinis]MBK5173319.1 type II toxin-antitoxin system RelB/DinJ family antitoxin [Streptococcus parasanguinis]MDB8615407.1 type II toxin-antitoxin system RelB/DinJ family antitoxin [Streptococcus parasanguinis]MDB8623668.1 type II toxin-antitoxin system RelB/DinJ family antitoxin [Streptococcus parasanguinis]